MPDKSNPYRFTLSFNEHDLRHRRVVEILNQQGKSKSQFIVTAILHYIDCEKLPFDTSVQYQPLEGVADRIIQETAERVLRGLEEKWLTRAPTPRSREDTPARPAAPDSPPGVDRELLSAGMGAFRTRK